MDCFTFMREVVDVLAIFPQGHALIVVSAIIVIAHAMRIPYEESADVLFDTKVDHFTGSFVPQIANATFGSTALLVPGSLQLLPATRILLAASLLLCNF